MTPSGFGFNTPVAAIPAQSSMTMATPQQSFGFNAQQSIPTTAAPAFGTQTTTPQGFGIQAVPPQSFGTLPTTFGTQPAPTSQGFGTQPSATTFGTQPASNPPSFGSSLAPSTFGSSPAITSALAPATQNPSLGGLSFGTNPANVATTAPPSFGFNSAPAQVSSAIALTTATQSSLFSAPISSQPSTSSTVSTASLFQAQPTITTNLQSLATTSAPATFTGLGGIDMSKIQQKAPEGKIEATKVKETQVPVQIIQAVEDFKNYVKIQKTISSEITRSTDRKLKNVTEEIQRGNCVVQEVSNDIDTNRSVIKHLRNETAKVIENADMAQRTHETPSGLQFENFLPQIYFKDLIQRYEMDLLGLKHQVELTEKHLQSLANPQNFSAQDMKRGLNQIHECFIALAGRVQEAHGKVEIQKEQYLQLRKFILHDTTNVFEVADVDKTQNNSSTSRVQNGPNAFSNQGGFNFPNISKISQQQQQPQTSQLPAFNAPQQAPSTSFFGSSASNFGFK